MTVTSFFLRTARLCCVLCVVTLSVLPAQDRSSLASAPVPADLNALCQTAPQRVENLFARLDLRRPGLAPVRALVEKKAWPEACRALLIYYRGHANRAVPLPAGDSAQVLREADGVLDNVFTFQEVTARQPVLPGGGLNWHDTGPRKDVEWGYFLNRHGYFGTLLDAWRLSGNPAYVKKFDTLVTDWVWRNPLPATQVSTVTWRELEVGLRLTASAWPRAFYGFLAAPDFSPVAGILMLSSIPEQAGYIYRYHRMHSNWAAMELNGLASAACYFPEFRDASQWMEHATQKMEEEARFEVYPDGVQNELTSHYHEVAMNNFAQFAALAAENRHPLPPAFSATLEKMFNYLAYTMRPDGNGLLNNDSDLDSTRLVISAAAARYHREDWRYIATGGAAGTRPAGEPSMMFPWAGQLVMRSGWDALAGWAFFDAGPWGNAHQHNDKLHLSVSALGHDWLVDAGRYYYKPDTWRRFFLSSAAHNVVLVNGSGQLPTDKLASAPLRTFSIQPGFDFCMGSYAGGFGSGTSPIPASHTRAVVYVDSAYWVVIDRLATPPGDTLEPLWHFAPSCAVHTEGTETVAKDPAGASLQVIPSEPVHWRSTLIRGQESPFIQGWYSKTYNRKTPATCARYQTVARDTATVFAWLILPSASGPLKARLALETVSPQACRVRVRIPGRPAAEITLRFAGREAVPLTGGLRLEGTCALRQEGAAPRVACGFIRSADGKTVASDMTGGR